MDICSNMFWFDIYYLVKMDLAIYLFTFIFIILIIIYIILFYYTVKK